MEDAEQVLDARALARAGVPARGAGRLYHRRRDGGKCEGSATWSAEGEAAVLVLVLAHPLTFQRPWCRRRVTCRLGLAYTAVGGGGSQLCLVCPVRDSEACLARAGRARRLYLGWPTQAWACRHCLHWTYQRTQLGRRRAAEQDRALAGLLGCDVAAVRRRPRTRGYGQ